MSNVIWTNVQELHDPIPDDSEDRIERFITDSENIIKAKLAPYVQAWNDASEPSIVQVIIKHMSCWTELKALYGSQVEEFHDWIRDFRELPWDLLHELIEMLQNGFVPEGFNALQSNALRSNTKTFEKIFNLNKWESQSLHPDDSDIRYGEDT